MLRAAEARWRQLHVDTMHALRAFLLEQMRQAVSHSVGFGGKMTGCIGRLDFALPIVWLMII